jgi:hypothetical protein
MTILDRTTPTAPPAASPWVLVAYDDVREMARHHEWRPHLDGWDTWRGAHELHVLQNAGCTPGAPLTEKQTDIRDAARIGVALAARDYLKVPLSLQWVYDDAAAWVQERHPWGDEWEAWCHTYELRIMRLAGWVPPGPGQAPVPLTRDQAEVLDAVCVHLAQAAYDHLGTALHPHYQHHQ